MELANELSLPWTSQVRPTEIWEDNTSCALDVRVHFLQDLVRDGAVKLVKCAGPKDVTDALTMSLPKPLPQASRVHARDGAVFLCILC